MSILLETTLGDIVIDLDIYGSPELCKNIIKLVKVRYYTSTIIYNIIPNRFCLFGDPTGTGTGGTCIYGLLDNTVSTYYKSNKRFLKSTTGRVLTESECCEKGQVIATCIDLTKQDTIGSQFLITTSDGHDHALDGYNITNDENKVKYLSLGKVMEDENNVLDKLNNTYIDTNGRPYADIRIIRALVIYDPYDDIPGMEQLLIKQGVVIDEENDRVISSPSPERPIEEHLPKRISASEVVGVANNNDDDEIDEEIVRKQQYIEQEEIERRDEKSRAVVLEMVGDLPDAEIRAPDDTLFICKLNPVTHDDDLQLIFSRFDENVKIEIIRDQNTGASLQYAFAEFTNKQAAEEAYFKMNNALIDDRRIKVDFSQSVAKLWDKYKQKMRMPKSDGPNGTFRTSSDSRRQDGYDNNTKRRTDKYYKYNHRPSFRNNNNNRDNINHQEERSRRSSSQKCNNNNNRHHAASNDPNYEYYDDFGRSRQFRRHQHDDNEQHRRKGTDDNNNVREQQRGGRTDNNSNRERHYGQRRGDNNNKEHQEDYHHRGSWDRKDRYSRHDRDDDDSYGRGDGRRHYKTERRHRREDGHDNKNNDILSSGERYESEYHSNSGGRRRGRDDDEKRRERRSKNDRSRDRESHSRDDKHQRDRSDHRHSSSSKRTSHSKKREYSSSSETSYSSADNEERSKSRRHQDERVRHRHHHHRDRSTSSSSSSDNGGDNDDYSRGKHKRHKKHHRHKHDSKRHRHDKQHKKHRRKSKS